MKNALNFSRAQFLANAPEILLSNVAAATTGKPRQMGTGSCGWNCNGKGVVPFGDSLLPVQISANVVVIGSKDFTPEQKAAFDKGAKEIILGAIGQATTGKPRQNKADADGKASLGWYCTGKGVVAVEGLGPVKVQIGSNVTVIGSKELPAQ
jgi:hypothetical protein